MRTSSKLLNVSLEFWWVINSCHPLLNRLKGILLIGNKWSIHQLMMLNHSFSKLLTSTWQRGQKGQHRPIQVTEMSKKFTIGQQKIRDVKVVAKTLLSKVKILIKYWTSFYLNGFQVNVLIFPSHLNELGTRMLDLSFNFFNFIESFTCESKNCCSNISILPYFWHF